MTSLKLHVRISSVFSAIKQSLAPRLETMFLIGFEAAIVAAGFEILLGNRRTSESLGVVGFISLTACVIIAAINVIKGTKQG